MRYVVLAAGFDGTLARDGRCDARSIAALRALAASGRKLILVTARELRDLLDVFPEARLFDYLVVENGAVVHRPSTRESAILAHAPPEVLIHELRRLRVEPLDVGSAIITTPGDYRETIAGALSKLGLECDLLENDRALSILPSGVNKATGVGTVLEELGLSERNLVAIGDAENDLALFELAEHSVAVSNADGALKRVADRVTRAAYAEGVIEFANELLENDLATAPVRRRIVLGSLPSDIQVSLPPARGAVLVTGPVSAAKSALCSSVLRQYLAQRYQCCVIGDYSLRVPEPDARLMSFGDEQSVPRPSSIISALEHPGQSILVNIVGVAAAHRETYIEELLAQLATLQARLGRPHAIIFDQAEGLFSAASCEAIKRFDASMTLFVAAHPNLLPKALLARMDVVVALNDAGAISCFKQIEAPQKTDVQFIPIDPGQALVWMRSSVTAPFRISLDVPPGDLAGAQESAIASSTSARARAARADNDKVIVS